jgi:hypothetical protein
MNLAGLADSQGASIFNATVNGQLLDRGNAVITSFAIEPTRRGDYEAQQGFQEATGTNPECDVDAKGAPGIKFVVSYGYSVAYGPRRCCCR